MEFIYNKKFIYSITLLVYLLINLLIFYIIFRYTNYNYKIKLLLILIINIIIVLALFRKYKKILKNRRENPIFFPSPSNSKNKYTIDRKYIPVSSNSDKQYSISLWIWLQESDYSNNNNKWKHILHIGDPNANKCQPSIWLDPKLNKLVIFFDSYDKSFVYDPIVKNKMYKSHNDVLRKNDSFEIINNKRLRDLKEACNDNIDCKSISFECSNNSNNSLCKYGILSLNNHDNRNFFKINNEQLKQLKSDGINYIGTIDKNENDFSLNPNTNPKIFDENYKIGIVDNIPIGRWFHLAIVVDNQTAIIYLDGMLKQTIFFQSSIRKNQGNLYVTQDGGYSGLLSQLRYFNKALFYKDINKIYSKGPKLWMWPFEKIERIN